MEIARPGDVSALSGLLAAMEERSAPLAVTGDAGRARPEALAALEREGAVAVATAAFDGIVHHEPWDLVVTARAGTRLESLREALAREDQWLPAAAPGFVDALPGSVGGLVAAAPPGPFDTAFGPLGRHLLACRVVARDGEPSRWGRPVMKHVAGYAVHKLVAGSHGRLGVVVEVGLRTWPAPAATERWRLAPGRDHQAPLELGAELVAGTTGPSARPDALVWTWRDVEPAAGRLEIRLLGTAESVEARRNALGRWAAVRGAELARIEGEPASAPARDRSLRRVVLRFTERPSRLPDLARRLQGALPEGARMEAFPETGVLRCAWEREPTADADASVARDLFAAAGGAAPRVERGGPAEIAAFEGEGGSAPLESLVLRALGGGPRSRVADYL